MDVNLLVAFAKSKLDEPFVHQGRGVGGYDCIGLVLCGLAEQGVEVEAPVDYGTYPTGTKLLARIEESGLVFARDTLEPKPGDLLVFKIHDNPQHVGLSLGDGQFIHATSASKFVRLAHLGPYWKNNLIKCYGWLNG